MTHDALHELRNEASEAADKAVAYNEDEPVKAMPIAAGSRALTIGLIAMMARSRS